MGEESTGEGDVLSVDGFFVRDERLVGRLSDGSDFCLVEAVEDTDDMVTEVVEVPPGVRLKDFFAKDVLQGTLAVADPEPPASVEAAPTEAVPTPAPIGDTSEDLRTRVLAALDDAIGKLRARIEALQRGENSTRG